MDPERVKRIAAAREKSRASAAAMTDEEDAELTAAALSDPDNPPFDEHWFRNASSCPTSGLPNIATCAG